MTQGIIIHLFASKSQLDRGGFGIFICSDAPSVPVPTMRQKQTQPRTTPSTSLHKPALLTSPPPIHIHCQTLPFSPPVPALDNRPVYILPPLPPLPPQGCLLQPKRHRRSQRVAVHWMAPPLSPAVLPASEYTLTLLASCWLAFPCSSAPRYPSISFTVPTKGVIC